MMTMKKSSTIFVLVCLIFNFVFTPCLEAEDKNSLIGIKSLDKRNIIYTINDLLVYWDDDKVVMYDIVLNHNIQAFGLSDFAKDNIQNKVIAYTSDSLSFVDGQMYQYNAKGLCCYDPKTGKRLWNNAEILPQGYYKYYNPVVSNNGILYVIKYHYIRSDIQPLLFCIDSKDGKIVNQQNINTDKFNAKYKNIINNNAQIIAIYNNKLIVYPQGLHFYCYNVQTSEIEWVSEYFLSLRWSTPKYTVFDDLLIFRQELDDLTIVVPPCTIDDYYAPGVGVYSLKDGKRLFFKKGHDFIIRNKSLYLFKFSECSNETNYIERYEFPSLKLVKTLEIPYKIKFSYSNLECINEFERLIYFVTEEGNSSYRLTSLDLDEFVIRESSTTKKGLHYNHFSDYIYQRIHSTKNFMLIITNDGMDVYMTKQKLLEFWLRLINVLRQALKKTFN